MQRIIACLLVSLSLAGARVFGQQVNTPVDSLPGVLCHSWVAAYAMMGDKKTERMPGATDIILNFVSDHTVVAVSTKDNSRQKGKWTYDPDHKQIRWNITGGGNGTIVSLTADEMVTVMDMKKATPDEPTLKVVYKRRQL